MMTKREERLLIDKAECVKVLTMVLIGLRGGSITTGLSIPRSRENETFEEQTLEQYMAETLDSLK